ncbi:MAG: response regulator [Gammaproteobacteria bacterium]|nr:response regulator [Gammaproteobacteria bacterium]MDH5652974.1 response regulator [Gammaproteobacteria bacterium]
MNKNTNRAEKDDKQLLEKAHKLGADLCHDAAAQLLNINGIAGMLETLLPRLLQVHETAVSAGITEPFTQRDQARLKHIQSGLPDTAAKLSYLHQEFWETLDKLVMEQGGQHTAVNNSTDQHIGRPEESIKCRVLVVDDEPVFQEAFVDLFECLECEVSTANSGEQALSLMAKDRFNLVLMDCRMPQLDGFETTRRIREQETETKTPIIGLTASPLESDHNKGLLAGMDDFITKPLQLDQARVLISRYARP